MCHKEVKPLWDTHGHSRMLRKAEGSAPEGVNVTLPEGMTWGDVSYLIGGDLYYARFANSQGYVVTGPGAQWSMRGESLTPFKADIENGTLEYSCVKCHTTGWMNPVPTKRALRTTCRESRVYGMRTVSAARPVTARDTSTFSSKTSST